MAFQLADSLGFIISRTNMRLKNKLFRRFRPYNVTPEQWAALNCLWERDGITPKEIADRIYKDKPNTNHILQKLLDKNLIFRTPHESDGRAWRIYLTEDGRALKDILIPIAEELLGEATAGIEEEKVRELKALLHQILKNLG
jgi:DNA-binding MarR family transcriptional regulator